MKYTAALLAASVALANAQSSSPTTSNSPYIPENGISETCANFLYALDRDAELAACSSSLLTATSLFDPTTAGADATSDAQVDGGLRRLCSSSSACSSDLVKQSLTHFAGNCSGELSANNAVVKSNYDVLYTLVPFTTAVCTKDTAGAFCATQVGQASTAPALNGTSAGSGSSNSTSNPNSASAGAIFIQPHVTLANLYINISEAAMNAARRLRKRQSVASAVPANSTTAAVAGTTGAGTVDETAILPNATTFRTTNLPFLFISGDMTSSQLCTSCTKSILASYVSWETDFPYATGLASSPILGGQAALWTKIGGVCGSGFLTSITQQAGSTITSGAGRSTAVATGVSLLSLGLAAFAFLL